MKFLPSIWRKPEIEAKANYPVDNRSSWTSILEPFTGAWQRNISVKRETVLTYGAVFRCISLISSDVAKMRVRVMSEVKGVREEITDPITDALRKPNKYQTRIQFFESWMNSKLVHGNTYVLKIKDTKGRIEGLTILDPTCVTPLVADNGTMEVFYRLKSDNLSGITQDEVVVPASEIIHDRWNCLYHSLVGLSPIYACGVAATQGIKIQNNSANFFENGANPGGILTAPGKITSETAERLRTSFNEKYQGDNVGKVAVLGDGLEYKPMAVNAKDSQLIDQLKWSAETVCSVFGVPAFKILGQQPTYDNVNALGQQYYSECLQIHIESIEELLDVGLGIKRPKGVEFNLDQLFRMDTKAMVEAESISVKAGIKAPNESRRRLNLPDVEGGDSPFMQEQNWSLEDLANRAALEDETDISALDAEKAIAAINKGFLH